MKRIQNETQIFSLLRTAMEYSLSKENTGKIKILSEDYFW